MRRLRRILAARRGLFGERRMVALAFLVPALFLYSVFFVAPIIASGGIGLTDWRGIRSPEFIGAENFVQLFLDSGYVTSVWNTVVLILYGLLIQIPIALFLAYLLWQISKGVRVYRAILFFPVVVAPVAIATMFSVFYHGEFGPINQFLSSVGLGAYRQRWLSDFDLVLHSVIIPEIWRFIGLHVVILLAGLQGIPDELVESAVVDGAGRLRIFLRIILPMLKHILLISMILMITGSFKSFEFPLILTDGGPGTASSFLALYMFRRAFVYQQYGYGSAITITILLYALVLTLVARKLLGGERASY